MDPNTMVSLMTSGRNSDKIDYIKTVIMNAPVIHYSFGKAIWFYKDSISQLEDEVKSPSHHIANISTDCVNVTVGDQYYL